jgi:GDP-L-fucose synthase
VKDPFSTAGIPYYRGKRVAVTGASGLIGSYAVKLLKESGAWVLAYGNQREPNEFTCLADRVIRQDLLFGGPDLKEFPLDAVIGCAGITGGVALPSQDPVTYVGPATAMVINTLDACHRAGIKRFGFLSSTTVYAPQDTPCKEEDVDRPEPLYPLYRGIGESKRWLEKLCKYYAETTGIGVGIVRPSGAYGRFDQWGPNGHVLPSLIERALRLEPGQPFTLWGDGQDVRDFVHASDVARGLLLAVAESPNAEPFNVASGTGVTTHELAQAILSAVDSTAEIVCDPSKPSALRSRLVDVSKAERSLGFKAEISLADGIRDVVEWRRKQL